MKEENLFMPDCIRTFSGKYVNVFDPDPETIVIEDIAHALSHQCRFGGHLSKFYSVAQHSVLASYMIHKEHKLQALMHDSAEAYLLDIPSPIKKRLTGYCEIEDNLLKTIGTKFGFDPVLSEEVKAMDLEMLNFEWDNLMLQKNEIFCWPRERARENFLQLFNLLTA